MRSKRKWVLVAALVGVGVLAAVAAWPAKPRNFGVVRPGVLYRSGQLTPAAFDRVLTEHGIRTVVTLRPVRDAESNADTWEEDACRGRGVRYVRVNATDGGMELAELVAKFLDVVGDPANHPVLVHCLAGRDRTGTACAAFRIEFDGWTPERAAAEMQEYGFDPDRDAPAKAYEKFVLDYKPRRATAPR
jgi:tyrosine-protein phosphatase SIW14